ncbi:MAG: ribonucleoside-diphosphate reductase, adenosylcobalamin-dependent [Parcubacteria group bacterium CG1_02_37_51]|nr:MAG: ribonucleoside-diphosphate reductase, adenosylcobalamin-dependent [Parcubacteria group bacterium CG1_02_37_51]
MTTEKDINIETITLEEDVQEMASDSQTNNDSKTKTQPMTGLQGLKIEQKFSTAGVHPFDEIEWELREASITNEKGDVVFSQKDVEVPADWSQQATNIVISKYFRGRIGTLERERSVKQMVGRVADTISRWGKDGGYFNSEEDGEKFNAELTYLLLNQYAAFNSPVWFNVGVEKKPQCSACFINSVEDDMKSILNLAVTEGMLFKYGSGTGTNFSSLRSSKEYLANSGGKSSGPVSFMRGFDSFAGVIKSGGKTRRAAKMVILNIEHPDIVEFINSKSHEEQKAWALIDAGYDGSFNGEAYQSVFFQNANNSIRVTDDFMRAVEDDGDWYTKYITSGEIADTYKARTLMSMICEATWICGDPGMQFDTIINKWHTCKKSGRINASNPCSEFMFLDDSACNLASLNLLKFADEKGNFDADSFRQAVEIIITAQEIIVENSAYPTERITQNSIDYRPLGLGYANLGAILMLKGLAYDSTEGRNFAGAVTSLMTGAAYQRSAAISANLGPFKYYQANEDSFLEVIAMHRAAAYKIKSDGVPEPLWKAAKEIWDDAYTLGHQYGFKNAQVSVLAPTGTIAFLMDCDTTGIEPDIALVKYKWLVGGGLMKLVNNTVKPALVNLSYGKNEIEEIIKYIDEHDTIENAPYLKEEHLTVFDCAFKPKNGMRSIHYMGHLKMMGAVQPFLSGAISKTVNLPKDATEEDVWESYLTAWKLGIKAVAVYRDGSKRTQPLNTSKDKDEKKETEKEVEYKPMRKRMPDERTAVTHSYRIGNHKGYITVGLYEDGTPGEIFIAAAKEGSVISGLLDSFALSISLALQYGVPLKFLVNKFVHSRFEPSGYTNNPDIKIAKSIVDYIFRWLAIKYLSHEDQSELGVNGYHHQEEKKVETAAVDIEEDMKTTTNNNITSGGSEFKSQTRKSIKKLELDTDNDGDPDAFYYEETEESLKGLSLGDDASVTFAMQEDAPPCDTCGSIMVRNGACYKCLNCGGTSGCS